MADKVTYRVKREHIGDKPYVAGDTRELAAADAAHLVRLGVLEEAGGKAKKAPAHKNKADPALENKEAGQ